MSKTFTGGQSNSDGNGLALTDVNPESIYRRCSRTKQSGALNELRAVVGFVNARTDNETLARFARSSFAKGTTPLAVVRPSCTEEVQEVVKIAGRCGLTVHPVSCGKNWGYGDACAPSNGQVILDLKRMNRIIEVNDELAYATIEPGVSQGQLADYLRERHPTLWMDATGAGPEASIVGNTLERGFGHTQHGDRFLHACGMEVILADGRLLKTGFGHYKYARASGVYKWGVGPWLDGLFSQSNLGIVTRLTFWLIPKPENFSAFFFTVRNKNDLSGLIEALQPLRLRGTLRSTIHLFNAMRLVAAGADFPWEKYDGKTQLAEEVVDGMAKEQGVDAWTGSGALYGSKSEVAAALKEVKRALNQVRGLRWFVSFDDRRLRHVEMGAKILRKFGIAPTYVGLISKLRMVYDLLQGRASDKCLRGAQWRVRHLEKRDASSSPDPLDHRAGFYWVSPVLPTRRFDVERFTVLAEPIFKKHGFEYQVTFSMVTARALCAVTTIAFDQSNAEEAQRAEHCHDELWTALLIAGYIPYRAGNPAMKRLRESSEVFWDVALQIKDALDPLHVISPGHYLPNQARKNENVAQKNVVLAS